MHKLLAILILTGFLYPAYAAQSLVDTFKGLSIEGRDFIQRHYTKQYYDLAGSIILDLNNGRSAQYGLEFPKAPIMHTYNPTDPQDVDSFTSNGIGVPIILVNVRFPTKDFVQGLPPALQEHLKDKDIKQLEIFWIVQNNPWTSKANILLRPNYWTDPDAPFSGTYSTQHSLHGYIIDADHGIRLDPYQFQISTHPGDQNMIVSSPASPTLQGAARQNESYSFWSIIENGNKIAVTLHWILKEEDVALLKQAIANNQTLENLVREMNMSSLADFSGLQKLDRFIAHAH